MIGLNVLEFFDETVRHLETKQLDCNGLQPEKSGVRILRLWSWLNEPDLRIEYLPNVEFHIRLSVHVTLARNSFVMCTVVVCFVEKRV